MKLKDEIVKAQLMLDCIIYNNWTKEEKLQRRTAALVLTKMYIENIEKILKLNKNEI